MKSKVKKLKTTAIVDDSSTDEHLIESSDSENQSDIEHSTSSAVKELAVGKWILVKYCIANQIKFYVGKITKSYPDECEGQIGTEKWEVHYLKRSQKTSNNFVENYFVNFTSLRD